MTDSTSRRAVLATTAGLLGALAGCTGDGSGGGSNGGGAGGTDGSTTAADGDGSSNGGGSGDGTTSGPVTTWQGKDGPGNGKVPSDHPATRKLSAQPRWGPPPAKSDGTVVAFEDPSCPLCKRFETGTVPELERLAKRGRLTLFFRGYPVVYPWGEPASHALEATFDRDEAAFRTLKDAYFRNQDRISSKNVHKRTRDYLARTDVDGEAVVKDVKNDAYQSAVDTDLQAGKDAGISETPTVVLFKNGSERTRISGSASASTIKKTLGL